MSGRRNASAQGAIPYLHSEAMSVGQRNFLNLHVKIDLSHHTMSGDQQPLGDTQYIQLAPCWMISPPSTKTYR